MGIYGAELRYTIRSSHQNRTLADVVRPFLLMDGADRISTIQSVILTLRYTRGLVARLLVGAVIL